MLFCSILFILSSISFPVRGGMGRFDQPVMLPEMEVLGTVIKGTLVF